MARKRSVINQKPKITQSLKIEQYKHEWVKKYCLENDFSLNAFLNILVLKALVHKKLKAPKYNTIDIELPVSVVDDLKKIKPESLKMCEFLGYMVELILDDNKLIPKKGERSPAAFHPNPTNHSPKKRAATAEKRRLNPPKCLLPCEI